MAQAPGSFFFNDAATTEIYTLSLHDALPICDVLDALAAALTAAVLRRGREGRLHELLKDRKSTRLNSSHVSISYAVFCLKKKKIAGEYVGILFERVRIGNVGTRQDDVGCLCP